MAICNLGPAILYGGESALVHFTGPMLNSNTLHIGHGLADAKAYSVLFVSLEGKKRSLLLLHVSVTVKPGI